jgi:hypothetical protein
MRKAFQIIDKFFIRSFRREGYFGEGFRTLVVW